MAISRKILSLAVGGFVVICISVSAISAFINATHQRALVRSGNSVYWEYRDFLKDQPSDNKILWFDCCSEPANRASIAVMPIYTKSWSGLTDRWKGEVRIFDATAMDDAKPSPADITSGLVAFDQTRPSQSALTPSALADRLGVDWATAWVSPPPHAAQIVVFDASRTRSGNVLALPVPTPPLNSGDWRPGGVTVPIAESDNGQVFYSIVGEDPERTELLRTEVNQRLAPGEYVLRFTLADLDSEAFSMVRIDTKSTNGESVRYDIRISIKDDEALLRPTNMLDTNATLNAQGHYAVEATFIVGEPSDGFFMSIYPSAGVNFPLFDKRALGRVLIGQPELIQMRAAP